MLFAAGAAMASATVMTMVSSVVAAPPPTISMATEASGRLYLVDLAASESFETVHEPGVGKASPPAGDHFGLLALGKVLTALAGGRTHVPYREATLTKLLQQALP